MFFKSLPDEAMQINPHNNRPQPIREKMKPVKNRFLIVAFLLLLTINAAAWFYFIQQPKNGQRQDSRQSTLQSKQAAVIGQTTHPDNATAQKQNITPAKKKLSPDKPLDPTDPEQQCKALGNRLSAFFDHLDQTPYIKEFNLDKPAEEYFKALTTKLLTNPPTVTRESDDLYTILTNTAHFFRTIGRRNILLIKGILDRESDKTEDIAADLYQWNVTKSCSDPVFTIQAPFKGLYNYAGFFLNTMGGRSYLFRRDSRSRLLVSYYAILIIDEANRQQENFYGLDILPLINQFIGEIQSTNQLIYKETYIDKLLELQKKYQKVR